MKILHALMRFYAYLFTLFISLFLGGISLVAFLSGLHNWKLDTFIWTGQDLSIAMLTLAVLGVAAVLLAFFNIFRGLLPLVALAIFGIIIYGFFWNSYKFADRDQFDSILLLAVAAFVSFLCSLMLFRRQR
ncbi:hypothetical protein [Bryobacter aggregatus]|uniref:hypothetical protein n=1 Tax=Bryobacter aggregatus TaxID=360054 RepID=UPI0012BACF4B|nr:hypothetical protein [Bryobacter aggregatus]